MMKKDERNCKWNCCGMNVYCQYSYAEFQMLNVMVLAGGATTSWLGHEGRSLMNGISDYRRGSCDLAFLPCENTRSGLLNSVPLLLTK